MLVDHLAQREDYTQIIKIFHISLLYFPIGNGNGAIYHGKTIMHEIETNQKLSVHITDQQTGQVFDTTDILPEYFYISVPLFNDRLEKEIDDWLHVMKYDAIPQNYHSPYMLQVAEKLSILKMTPEERTHYSYYQKKLHNDRDELRAAETRGEARGIEIGEARLVKMMLINGNSIEEIARITKLPVTRILELHKVA